MKKNRSVRVGMPHIVMSLIALAWLSLASAKGVYQEPEDFIAEAFGGSAPDAERLFLKGDLKKRVKEILGHRYKSIKIPYWQDGDRTVWILDEIGKDLPITTGFIINNGGQIERVKVLIFRESRGWEVRHDFFTDQFLGLQAKNDYKNLNGRVENVTGATLSVNAIKKLSRMALYLHSHVQQQ